MNIINKDALLHALKVAAYIAGSSAIPALIALYEQDPRWLALAPVLNIAAAYLIRWSAIRRSL